MNYIELTIYIVIPEPTAFAGRVDREAMVILKGHPRVVVPLANMIQEAAQVLGGKRSEDATREPEMDEKGAGKKK